MCCQLRWESIRQVYRYRGSFRDDKCRAGNLHRAVKSFGDSGRKVAARRAFAAVSQE